jgi:hypothetical protein
MMGYTTEFNGDFELDKELVSLDMKFLVKLNETRRMKREFAKDAYGKDGEMYVYGGGEFGQDHEDSITDYNSPPESQPSLWCHWRPNEDGTAIEWDGGEKFYGYVEWIEWIIDRVIEPRGYILNGAVEWSGEDEEDVGVIRINDNRVNIIGERR